MVGFHGIHPSLRSLAQRKEALFALVFLGASGMAWGVAILKGLSGCPLCAAQRWGVLGISLGFIISLRFKTLGLWGAMIASGTVMERAYAQLMLENGVRLEQFAYLWNLYQNAPEAGQTALLPLMRPFYALGWPFQKLATYSLILGFGGMVLSVKELGASFHRQILGRRENIVFCKNKDIPSYRFWIGLFFIGIHPAESKDFGVQGALFEIVEEDFVTMIEAKAQKMDIHALQTSWKKHAEHWTPHPVAGLKATTTPRTFTFDPTYTVPTSWSDHEGRVFAPRGMKVNPLKIVPFKGQLVFVQGDSSAQMTWVKELPLSTKVILVSGSPLVLMKETGRTVYFDQGGVLTRRLGITQVPALVHQEGYRLRVEEKREVDL